MSKSRLILSAAAAAILLGAGSALVAPTAVVAQTASAGVEVPPLGFQKRTLPNGLDVYTARDTSTSNVTVQAWYRVGSKDDPAGRSGFAHLFEHLMFKSTENMPAETFDRLTEDVGGFNNASTWDDFTNYYEVVPANHLERLIFAAAGAQKAKASPSAARSGSGRSVISPNPNASRSKIQRITCPTRKAGCPREAK